MSAPEDGWGPPQPCTCGGQILFNYSGGKVRSAHSLPLCEAYQKIVDEGATQENGLLLLEDGQTSWLPSTGKPNQVN